MSHPDFLPTGRATIGRRRDWGTLPLEERLGVAVVGLHEGHTMLVALRASGLCRAVAGCDLAPEKLADAQASVPGLFVTERYADVLARDDVQIVCIYTPDVYHADQIEAAFRAGKHVVCTKPLINCADDVPRLLRAQKETGMRLQVGQSTRFGEPFLRQRELADQGVFGTVEAYDAHYHHRMDWYYDKSPWTIRETHWAYLGLSHPVDLVRWYLGEIREVQAMGYGTALAREYGLATPDCIAVNFRAADGRVGRAFGNYGMHELPRGRSLIEGFLMGSAGSSLARYPDLRLTYTGVDGTEIEEDYTASMTGYYSRHELLGMHYGEFTNIVDSFARALLDGTPNAPDLREGLQTVLVMDAIVRALESGETTRVPPLDRL